MPPAWLRSLLRTLRRAPATPPAHLSACAIHPSAPSADPAPSRTAGLTDLLAEMRRRRSADSAASADQLADVRSPSFRLAVDDAGEFLVVVGEAAAIGHLRAADVELPFLADLELRHARLRLVEDFHAGARWILAVEPGASAQVEGVDVGGQGVLLADGTDVRLASNLAFRFSQREAGSASAVLELLRGAECWGASRVLLLAPGRGGRVRLGSHEARHVVVGGLEQEVELEVERDRGGWALAVRCAGGVRGAERDGDRPQVRLELPLRAGVTLTARARRPGAPPFALVLSPLDRGPADALER